ncbi:DHA2 family methylenomycin A resistance protein-like MFS transporter [Paraburkholderia graminis]|nr:DHA2 family methylenomycin A resistance protein-like MFS transporter [Paraburkholderia graminis]
MGLRLVNNENESQKRVLTATSLSYVVVILDTSIVNVALEPVAASLGSDITGLQWVVNAYTLTFASLLLSGGVLGDRVGAKSVYLAGLLIFACASALCGFAPDLQVLIAARILQGIGAALLVPCSLTLINSAFPVAQQRAGAIGVWAGCGGVAMAAGPLVGGLLIHLLGWRSIFLVNVPIALLGAWLTTRIESGRSAVFDRPLDLAGQMLAIVALGASVAVLIEGAKLGWHALVIRVGVVTAIIAWIAFVLVEFRRRQPMLPLYFFRHPTFSASAFASMISGLVFYGLFFLLSLYFQSARGWPPLQTGLAFLPLTVMVTIGSFASGALNRAYGAHKLVCGGFLLYALGFAGLLALADDAPYWRIALCFPAVGFGAGVITPAATAALMAAVNKGRAGVAAGVLNASRQTGAAFGVAIFGALMSAAQPLNSGVRVAVYVAIGLSLLAALLWSLASVLATRYARGTA